MPGPERRGKKKEPRGGLVDTMHADRFAVFKGKPKARDETEGDEDGAVLLPSDTTQKILKAARHQLQEEGDDIEDDTATVDEEANMTHVLGADGDGIEYGADDDDDDLVELEYDDHESVTTEVENFDDLGEHYEIDDEEARILQKFQPASGMQSRNLADIIFTKIKEQELARKAAEEATGVAAAPTVDKRVSRVYIAIGHVLKRFTSGKIPKAFKVLPHIQNWEELLMLTNPHDWSPHATYNATRIFAANLNERLAQRFYSTILLPIIMDRLTQEKRLHPALYMAVRKALFKPVAFFKGFLLPLIEDDECTLRMALVVASVLQKMHLPPLPTAVVLYSLSRLPFRGANCVFLRVLIDKKMKLPLQVIDALVGHFHRFIRTHSRDEILPVLWHQTLLSFVQRYKENFNLEQIQLLRDVCDHHFHHMITPEVRREMNIAAQQLNNH